MLVLPLSHHIKDASFDNMILLLKIVQDPLIVWNAQGIATQLQLPQNTLVLLVEVSNMCLKTTMLHQNSGQCLE